VGDIGREDIEAFQADQLTRFKPNTAALRHRTLKVFFNWLVTEEEIPRSPMVNVKPQTSMGGASLTDQF
ncbi:MAG TPA: hypothetical protein VNF71_09650, partial [Acidimicrobiales bacterium]|nr:hypothetical protein [Acidimicrobiales bacterium]